MSRKHINSAAPKLCEPEQETKTLRPGILKRAGVRNSLKSRKRSNSAVAVTDLDPHARLCARMASRSMAFSTTDFSRETETIYLVSANETGDIVRAPGCVDTKKRWASD